MAYNVLKGTVEGSVDQHADQEIEGVKVFKSTISASVFYDTDAQSACATLKDLPITEVQGRSKNGILTYEGDRKARTHHSLTYDGEVLDSPAVRAKNFIGSADGLKNIPSNSFRGEIPASAISHGPGLRDVRGTLQVNANGGIAVDGDGVSVALTSTSGLAVKGDSLVIDASRAENIRNGGQNLSDNDLLLVSDVSRGSIHNTSLANFYDSYIKVKAPQAAGKTNEIQLKGNSGFAATSKLSYDITKDTLNVDGAISAKTAKVESALSCGGAVIKNIHTITAEVYEVQESDYTILCDAHKKPITVMLPPACNSKGRVLTVKKTNTDRLNLRSYPVTVRVHEGSIDLTDNVVLKMNYSSRTFQSDGNNWWVIGAKGS